MAGNVKENKNKIYFDFTYLFIVIFFLAFGLVMIYSTSYYSATLNQGDGFYYLRKQLISTFVGLGMMLFTFVFPYRFYKELALIAYVASAACVLLTLSPLGWGANGAVRWIKIGGLSLQVAEIVKVGVIIFVASILTKMSKQARRSWMACLVTLVPTGFLCALIFFLTNDFSSAFIIAGIAFMMLLLSAPANYKPMIIFIVVAIVGVLAVVMIINGWGSSIWGFRGERILAWRDPEKYIDGKGFQPLQAMYGIGSGGIFGKGLGKSIQKLGTLPEAQNDMIFSVICEEIGIFGGMAILLMFAMLLWRLVDIASYTGDYFGNMLITGVFSHIALQVLLNVAVVTGVVPNTGISLPFISYGGSSVMFLLAEIGITMNVAANIDFTSAAERKMQRKRKKASKKAEPAREEES